MKSSTIRIWSTTKAHLQRRAKALGLSLPAMVDRLTVREQVDDEWKATGDFYSKPEGRAFAETARRVVASAQRTVKRHT